MVFKSIAASFNLDDPFQKRIYDHVFKQSNSSWYLKSLAMMDMVGERKPVVEGEEFELDASSFS